MTGTVDPGHDESLRRRQVLELRARLLAAVRTFFTTAGYLEVTTPRLVLHADPALHLDSFATDTTLPQGGQVTLYLATSPEFFHKRLLAEGMERIFEIGPFFRRGELGPLHNPEFSGLEWYDIHKDLSQLMEQIEKLVHASHKAISGRIEVEPLPEHFPRFTLHQACRQLGGVELPEDFSPETLRYSLTRAGIHFSAEDAPDDLVNRILIERVEPRLAEMPAVFITEYPAFMAALARLHPQRPWVAQRCELYLRGIEVANAYQELTDAGEQRRRFESQLAERRRRGWTLPGGIDEAFLGALERGLPACAGCALGLERLLLGLTGQRDIVRAMPFPLAGELAVQRA